MMWLHVEPTTRCNAWCPGCFRNKNGYGLTDFIVEDLDPKILQNTLETFNIDSVQFCGTLGDPCAAKNIDLLLNKVVNMQRLQLHTNGSLRKPEWWADLAKRFSHLPQFDVWFALDGIGDVHSYYRQGTDYDRIIENVSAFIGAGGSAVWQFIPFKHNEHQIKDCIRLSQQLGFKRFEFVRNVRYGKIARDYRTGEPIDIQPWTKDTEYNKKHRISNTVEIKNCMHLSIPSVYLSATGLVTPCCYMQNTPLKTVDIFKEFSNNNYRTDCTSNCG